MSMLDLTSIDNMLSQPGWIPQVGFIRAWPFMLSTFLISRTRSYYVPSTSLIVGLMLFTSPWDLLGWDITGYAFRLIVRLFGRIGFVGFVTLGRSRLSLALFFIVPFTMRSKGDSTICSKSVGLFPHSLNILTNTILHSTFKRPYSFVTHYIAPIFLKIDPYVAHHLSV